MTESAFVLAPKTRLRTFSRPPYTLRSHLRAGELASSASTRSAHPAVCVAYDEAGLVDGKDQRVTRYLVER